MPSLEDLKKLLADSAVETIGQLWNSEQDKNFLLYNAEKLAKYALKLKDATTTAEKDEAQFNLDMLKASLAAYFHQKQITAERSIEEIAPRIAGLIIRIAIAAA